MGARGPFRHLSVAILLLSSLFVCAFAPRPSEPEFDGPQARPSATSDITVDPSSPGDPLRCTQRVPIPEITQAMEAKWSPDGSRLAYTRIITSPTRLTITGYEEDPDLGVLEIATGRYQYLGRGHRPAWSDSGTYLSYWRQGHVSILKGGRVIERIAASMPETRWVGDQLVYWEGNEIRGWTEEADVVISAVDRQYWPLYPRDWTEFSGDGQMFTLTRHFMDGRADRYVGQTRTGQLAPLDTPGATYTEWGPTGQTLLVRSDHEIELRGAGGWRVSAPVSSFPGPVHGWTPDGKALLVGAITPTVPVGARFDEFAVWDGKPVRAPAVLPNLIGSRSLSPDGKYFAGVARTGLYDTILEVYACGAKGVDLTRRADPVARARQERIDNDSRRFVRPVAGYVTQFLQGAHTGVDIAAPVGALITSAHEGQVTFVGWIPVGGRGVCVLHDGGLESCYFHTSLTVVTKGQWVGRGQPIALIGMTGLTTGPHVHWETKISGRLVDPLKH